jgi:hypothetical protein
MRSEGSREKLGALLKGLGRKRRNFLILKGLAGAAIVLLASVSLADLLSLLSDNPLYYSALKVLFIAAAAAGIYLFLFLPLQRKDSDDVLTSLDSLSPGLGEDTLSAVELGDDGGGKGPAYGSGQLASAHIDYAAGRLETGDLSSVYAGRRLKKYAAPLAASTLAAALVLFIAPAGFKSFLLSADLYPGESARRLGLADIELRLDYPAYTKLPQKKLSGGSGDVKALKGTKVTFSARPLEKFANGRLQFENGSSFPVSAKDGKINASFTVLGDGGYTIVESSKGRGSAPFSITVENDAPPHVTISTPGGEVIESDASGRIDIFYEAGDDFGLSEFRLSWEGEEGKSGRVIGRAPDGKAAHSGRYLFDTGGVDFGGGGTIKFRVEAYDNDSVSGPKPGVSNAITVKLSDEKQKHREVVAGTEKLMEELIGVLGDEIDAVGTYKTALASGNSAAGNAIKAQNSITSGIQSASSTLKGILEGMKEDNQSDYTQFLALANMDVRIDDLLAERRSLLDEFDVIDTARLGRLMEREILEFEEDVLYLDSMLKSERLKESLLSGRELLSEYGELSEMLSKLGETGDESLRAEIESKLRELEGKMAELARKMAEMSGDIREGFLNEDAFKSTDMKSKLDELRKMMESGDIDGALSALAQMEQSLQSMMASLESGLQSFGSAEMSQDMTKLGEIISKIGGLEREEENLKKSTEGIKQSLIEDQGAEGRSLRDFIEKQKEKVAEIKRNLAQAKAKITGSARAETSPDGGYLLDTVVQKADELRNWLDSMDISESLKNARALRETSGSLVELGDAGVGNLRAARPELSKSNTLADEIAKDLEEFLKSNQERPEAQGMAGRQDEIRKDTGDLGSEIEEMAKDLPLSPGISEKVSEAENHMGKASDSLGGNELSKAISNQDEAVKSLKSAREEAEGLLQKMQASARGNGPPVPMVLGRQQSQGSQGMDTRYVEIPAAEDSEVGREFKERIIEAMKSGSPEGYGELNRKYYDRIIK